MHRLTMVAVLLVTLFALPSSAQTVVRTWVASNGSDTNPCTRALPCRNFNAAIGAVDPGGEVVVLDSAGYGAAVITKNVSVIAPLGVHAAIAPTGGVAVDITDARATLRNLGLRGLGAAVGVEYHGTGPVFLEGLTIDGFTNQGVNSQGEELYVENCVVRNNNVGLLATSASATAEVSINGSRFEENSQHGVSAADGSIVSVRDSQASGNNKGFEVSANNGSVSRLTLMNCQATKNTTGVIANTDANGASIANLRIGYSSVVQNSFGLAKSGSGGVYSQGNNMVQDNGSNIVGTIIPFSGN